MTDERLIEEAAKAIAKAWQGVGSHADMARAALAVFEKAHTPTDDEREALEAAITKEIYGLYQTARKITDVVFALGFRRSEPQGPSAEVEFPFTHDSVTLEQDDGGLWIRINDVEPARWLGPKAISALRAAWAQPQGEPSDAQVDERGRHWWACAVNAPRADWVGPCDCDLSRDPSLTEHPAALRAAGEAGR